MTPPIETSHTARIFERPAQTLDTFGLFWLEPAAIQKVDELINITSLPTMSLGVETHSAEMPQVREQLAGLMVPEHDPLKPELIRALDVGFMYGRLIADESSAAHGQEALAPNDLDLPEQLASDLRRAAESLGKDIDGENNFLFTQLRSIEIRHANSDLLAYCLASAQDHLRQEFALNHKSDTQLSKRQLGRMQSMFYAGALVGALLSSDEQSLHKPKVEIMRTPRAVREPVSFRMEFEPSDDLDEALESALSSKLRFLPIVPSDGSAPYVALLPNGRQFAPNALSFPVFLPNQEEPTQVFKVPVSDIEALVVNRKEARDGKAPVLAAVEDAEGFVESPDEDADIVGLLIKQGCVGAYDAVHPNAGIVRELAAMVRGVRAEEVKYGSELIPRVLPGRRFGKLAVKLTLFAGVWIPDMINAITGEAPVEWREDLLLDGMLLGLLATYQFAKHKLRRGNEAADAHYQSVLDQITQYG